MVEYPQEPRTSLKFKLMLIKAINWESLDKDNMEFRADITYYQKEALEDILYHLEREVNDTQSNT